MTTPATSALLLLCLILANCGPGAAEPSEAASFPMQAEPLLEAVAPPPARPLTGIRFVQPRHDAGRVRQGRTIRHQYTFANTGREPLLIEAVYGSCSCILLDHPADAVAPGKQGAITVAFDTRHLRGRQQQAIVVAANTAPAQTTLYLSALVKP